MKNIDKSYNPDLLNYPENAFKDTNIDDISEEKVIFHQQKE